MKPLLSILSSLLLAMNANDPKSPLNCPAPSSSKTKVVIVGAGFAGLSVAYHLLQENSHTIEVELLEARDRIGGRVYPYKLLGKMIDLGGQWVHEASNLNPIRQFMENNNLTFHENSRYENRKECKENKIFDSRTGQEISKGITQMASKILRKALRDPELQATDMTSWRDLIDRQLELQRASDDRLSKIPPEAFESAMNYMVHKTECYEGGRMEERSAITDLYQIKGGPDEIPEGSYYSILQALHGIIQERGGTFRLGCLVDSIRYESERSNDCTVKITLRDGFEISADYCVCTVPLGVLQQRVIRFIPNLKAPKWKAINAMGMGLLDKLVLMFDTCFWPLRFGVTDIDATKVQNFYDASSEVGSPCLICFFGGNAARRVESQLSDDQVIEEVMTNLRLIFEKGGIVVPNPVAAKVTRWQQDPLSFGSYSFAKVGCTEETYDVLAAPVGNLMFAGEHTSKTSQATVHGAWETGQREANRLFRLISSSRVMGKVNVLSL
mmetsp:Transcript_5420/g.7843  ORF Transcript_5420/g.7843 Transcript_5420/m.7843 type:complete len:498 (+) Transcript_5420:25-1518(+)